MNAIERDVILPVIIWSVNAFIVMLFITCNNKVLILLFVCLFVPCLGVQFKGRWRNEFGLKKKKTINNLSIRVACFNLVLCRCLSVYYIMDINGRWWWKARKQWWTSYFWFIASWIDFEMLSAYFVHLDQQRGAFG